MQSWRGAAAEQLGLSVTAPLSSVPLVLPHFSRVIPVHRAGFCFSFLRSPTWQSAAGARASSKRGHCSPLLPPCWKPRHKASGLCWDVAIQPVWLQHCGDLGWLWSHTSPVGTLKDKRTKATADHAGTAQVPGTLGGLLELSLFLDMRDVQNPDRKRQLAGFEVICRPSLPGHRGKLEEGWRDFPSRLPPWHAA